MRVDPTGAEARAIAEAADFSGMKVIEIGCGDGRMTSMIADRASHVLAIDTDEETIAGALEQPGQDNVEYRVGDICDIKLEPGEFDAAFLALSL